MPMHPKFEAFVKGEWKPTCKAEDWKLFTTGKLWDEMRLFLEVELEKARMACEDPTHTFDTICRAQGAVAQLRALLTLPEGIILALEERELREKKEEEDEEQKYKGDK